MLDVATRIFADRMSGFDQLKPIFANTGIQKRHSVRPPEWFEQTRHWPERTHAFTDGATALFREAAGKALDQAGLEARDIDTIVTVSSTGIATPTIEARAMAEMGFRETTRRVPVFGLGCAGGVTGLAIAARQAAAEPGGNVLFVTIELCTLSFRDDEMTKSNLVATALFGDGAAAAVLSCGPGAALADIEHCYEHTWPGTLDIMGWRIDPVGFGAIFDRSIPRLVETRLRPVFDEFLKTHDLTTDDIDRYVFHPGGTKVIEALEATFGLEQGLLMRERDVLRQFGNMSAPTVLFVLNQALEDNRRKNAENGHMPALQGRTFLSTLGPGFTASFMTLTA